MTKAKATTSLVLASTTATLPIYENGIIRAIVLVVPTFSINTGAVSLTFDSATKTITRNDVGGDFIADGFLVGQHVKTDADVNTGGSTGFTVSDVAATVLTVVESVTDEGPVTKTATVVSASIVETVTVLDDDGDTYYSNNNSSSGWAEGTTHLISSLAIPCNKGYLVKATLDDYCSSFQDLTIKAYVEII